MVNTYRSALFVSAAALLGLLTACGDGGDSASAPRTLPGTAAPATSDGTTGVSSVEPTATASTPSPATSTSGTPGRSTRCHTSELEATLGRNDPGAGQENFPVILTNTSSRTCTLHGYPGAAFVDASGEQLGPDPKRTPGTPATVKLAPGQNAWSGITFSNPEISGARTANPDALLVTPPDERDPLNVAWSAGEVPVSGNESTVFITVFDEGPGA
ncbi:DUF4232 domain-containing protein [Streptomyces sp. NBC_00140]|uniref:DUF4232 domain-containing protein n=1 Tax=Streptomyces sp. NBC_00140 TaxID=2975664 RepID=UPI00224E2077|nr:DUF4232 domain-containing protein [Streptomyces sp. NBC_00140]MCX5329481.1 DUF4232 domain-containing protein [Streptomyces sp. NBC_00140]